MNQSNKDPFEKNIQNGINHNKNRYFKVEISKVVLINVITWLIINDQRGFKSKWEMQRKEKEMI